jgi:uncharacterized protein (DUF1697 family)
MRYAAFLRGINVGGNVIIKMADLKTAFERMGFGQARTILASGNILFESQRRNSQAIAEEIAAGLKTAFGRDIGAIVRSIDALRRLETSKPFEGIKVTPKVRLYVTFLSARRKANTIAIPYASPQEDLRILGATETELFSVLDLAKGGGTPEAMRIIGKEFGNKVTTRNWNTVLKMLK